MNLGGGFFGFPEHMGQCFSKLLNQTSRCSFLKLTTRVAQVSGSLNQAAVVVGEVVDVTVELDEMLVDVLEQQARSSRPH